MGRKMGAGWLTTGEPLCLRKKYRWLFFIDGISDDGTDALPPSKAARPSITFKEAEVQHLNETIYYPSKPDWKPINLTLYDTRRDNPVFNWLKEIYNPKEGNWTAPCKRNGQGFKRRARLELYTGCGEIIDCWVFDNIWPQVIEWGELDMAQNDIVTCELTLRYDRAYIDSCLDKAESVTDSQPQDILSTIGGNLLNPIVRSVNNGGLGMAKGVTPDVIGGVPTEFTESTAAVDPTITTPTSAFGVGGTKGPKIGAVLSGTIAGMPVSWGYGPNGPVAMIQGAIIPVPVIGSLPAKGLPGLPSGKAVPIRV